MSCTEQMFSHHLLYVATAEGLFERTLYEIHMTPFSLQSNLVLKDSMDA